MNLRRSMRVVPLVLVALLAPMTPQSAVAAPAVPPCLAPDPSSTASYEDPAGKPVSTVTTVFTPVAASCPDATYTFVVQSEDGSRLGWEPSGGSRLGEVSADGSKVTVTFVGAGSAESFAISGSVSKGYDGRVGCVLLTMTATDATRTLTETYPKPAADGTTGRLCKGPPAGNFYG